MNLLDWGVGVVLWVQGLGAWLLPVMSFFSFLGNEQFFLLVAPAVYWCLDAAVGLRLGLLLMVSAGVNGMVKMAFHTPRPYWYSPNVPAFTAEGSFGIPSGHSQNAVAVWGTLAAWRNTRAAWLAAAAVIFLIGFSRLYMGVHFPTDLLAGWLIGAALLWALLRLEPVILGWLRGLAFWQRVGAAFCASLAFILLGAGIRAALGGWELPAEWAANAARALPEAEPVEPLGLSGIVTNAGSFFGLAAGALYLQTRGGFNAGGPWNKRALRYLLGAVGVLALYLGLGAVFPRGESLLPYILRFVRYTLIGLWVAGLAPLLFRKLGLASE